MAQDENRKGNESNKDEKPNVTDAWLPSLVGGLLATSTLLVAVIILFFFHTK